MNEIGKTSTIPCYNDEESLPQHRNPMQSTGLPTSGIFYEPNRSVVCGPTPTAVLYDRAATASAGGRRANGNIGAVTRMKSEVGLMGNVLSEETGYGSTFDGFSPNSGFGRGVLLSSLDETRVAMTRKAAELKELKMRLEFLSDNPYCIDAQPSSVHVDSSFVASFVDSHLQGSRDFVSTPRCSMFERAPVFPQRLLYS